MSSMAAAPVGPFDAFDLANYDACIFDLDGTVWLGATDPIPGAADFLERCRDEGKRIAFATNAIVHAPETLSDRLCEAGLARPGEPVVTSGVPRKHCCGLVGAAVVERDERPVGIRLRQDRVEALGQPGLGVARGEDDGDRIGHRSFMKAAAGRGNARHSALAAHPC